MKRTPGLYARVMGAIHSHGKFNQVWRDERAALSLWVMALARCADQKTDGHVPEWWVEEKLPNARERARLTDALVDAGLWERNGTGWVFHDYADVNLTRDELEAERKRKSDAGKKGADARYGSRRK